MDDPGRSPVDWSLLDANLVMTHLAVLLVSLLGGFASFMRKVRSGAARAWNLIEFVGELTTAALVGLIAFWLCQSADLNKYLTAALVGVSSHMGTRALFLAEQWLERWIRARFPELPPAPPPDDPSNPS